MMDVFIIDDVHDFAGKEKTQDIFFHIFNHLHQSNKQLIFTADKPPVELQGLNNDCYLALNGIGCRFASSRF
jgi:chromosomal replication initiator protein